MTTRLRIRLRECLAQHAERTGRRLSYRELATKAGLSYDTLKAIGSRPNYNASLRTIERLCDALGVTPLELLEVSRRRS